MTAIWDFIRENAVMLRWLTGTAWMLVAVGTAIRFGRFHGRGRLWFAVVALAIAFAVESVHPVRETLTQGLRDAVRAVGGPEAYSARRVAQTAVIACLLLPAAAYLTARVIRNRALGWPAKLVLLGAASSLTGFVLEVISLHYLDQVRIIYPAFRFLGLVLALVGVVCARAAGNRERALKR